MYIYFELINSVLTCEEYPQIMSVDDVIGSKNLQNMYNKWIKNDNPDGSFTLSYMYEKHSCNDDNTQYEDLPDYNDYTCYSHGYKGKNEYEEGTNLYLQNSGHIDIVCVKPNSTFCTLCNIPGYPNAYKWTDPEYGTFALHVDDRLSDANVFKTIDSIYKYCHIEFVESL